MSFRDRAQEIQGIAQHIVRLTEREADELLRAAGAGSATRADWARRSMEDRRTDILLLLTHEDVDVIDRLALVTDATRSGVILADPASPPREQEPPPAAVEEPAPTPANSGPIFVVHGHAHATLHEAVRVLERTTGREVIVLHEQANAGRTILEKFEEHAAGAAYAVVLLTGDDEGGTVSSSDRRLRGRQNVIFELGFFFGTLGRRRIAVLREQDVEKPSDIDGLVYIDLDRAGAWKQMLARELTAIGIAVDFSRMP